MAANMRKNVVSISGNYVYDPTKPFNEQTRKLIRKTHPEHGPLSVMQRGKRFAIVADSAALGRHYMGIEQPVADGIGTKGALHWKMGTMKEAARDAMAMTLDDLAEGGYVPMWLSNVAIFQEEIPERIHAVIGEIVSVCMANRWEFEGHLYPIVVTGGETAIVNTVEGMEISMFVSGRPKLHGEILHRLKRGDVIVGLDSNGIHSNGISFLSGKKGHFTRRGMDVDSQLPFGATVGEELTKPTLIYLPVIMELMNTLERGGAVPNDHIHGMVHITGGGMSKLTELLPRSMNLDIIVPRADHRPVPELFRYVQKEFSITPEEMYSRFNNGTGYVIAVDQHTAGLVLRIARDAGFGGGVIGAVTSGAGTVRVESAYGSGSVEFDR